MFGRNWCLIFLFLSETMKSLIILDIAVYGNPFQPTPQFVVFQAILPQLGSHLVGVGESGHFPSFWRFFPYFAQTSLEFEFANSINFIH